MTHSIETNDSAWRERKLPGLIDTLGPLLVKQENNQWLYGLRMGPEHLNPLGIVHGGTITTLLDQAISTTAWSHLDKTPCVTVQLNVSFLGSARPGDLLVAQAQVIKATGSLVFIEGSIQVGDTVIATGQGVMKRIKTS